MNKDIMLEKIEFLSSMPHASLVEHCIYLENENDNYKAQKYITDFISENGIICEKNKKISELQQKIDKAIEYIKENILIDYYGMPCFNNQKNVEKLLEILGDKEKED